MGIVLHCFKVFKGFILAEVSLARDNNFVVSTLDPEPDEPRVVRVDLNRAFHFRCPLPLHFDGCLFRRFGCTQDPADLPGLASAESHRIGECPSPLHKGGLLTLLPRTVFGKNLSVDC